MDKETVKNIVKLGYAYGQARAACEYSGGVFENTEDEAQKKIAAISLIANKHAMDKTAAAFNEITKS